jgi:UDP-N-acetylmuramate dehydrogenase
MIYNTFAIPATADRYLVVSDKQELLEIIKNGTLHNGPFLILGGGSNIVFTGHYHGTILHPENKGIHLVEKDPATGDLLVEAAAGENWDGFVQHCIAQGWHGTENLAAIPGTVGAAPVQNVGAYGIEAKDIVHTVLTIDLATGQERTFTNEECCFGYRNSIFKETLKGKYLVWSVTFRLHSTFTPDLHYKALSDALTAEGIDMPTARQLADTIAKVRWSKLPRPEETGSAGSFFKRPEGNFAGKLIEEAGLRGLTVGGAQVSEKHCGFVINKGGATASDIIMLMHLVQASVKEQFGVDLEPEVRIIGEDPVEQIG